MTVVALTGGIATGKSTALAMMEQLIPGLVVFDCDQSAQVLLKDPRVLGEIELALGEVIKGSNGELDRGVLRDLVFRDPGMRRKLENVIHPRLRKECLEKLEETRKSSPTTLFVADVPLLFESGFDIGQECNVVVATTEVTQRARLKARSHFDDRMISSILAAQLPIMVKVARGDVVFWNEGPQAALRQQLSRFFNFFPSHD